jgi:hypothetical protein
LVLIFSPYNHHSLYRAIFISSLSYTKTSPSCFHFSLNFVSGLFFSSFYCCSGHSSDVDLQFFPGLAPLATPFCIHATGIKAGQSVRSRKKIVRPDQNLSDMSVGPTYFGKSVHVSFRCKTYILFMWNIHSRNKCIHFFIHMLFLLLRKKTRL